MKSLKSQNYYEILGVPRTASAEDVKQAYEISRHTFQKNSLATYSLFSDEENQEILALISRAYETLYDNGLRKEYDGFLGSLNENGEQTKTRKARKKSIKTPDKSNSTPVPLGRAQAGSTAETSPKPVSKNAAQSYIDSLEAFNGEALKKIRLMRGISIDEIAEQTKIRKTYIQYIEEENFDFLPAAVYIKGFITMIAGLLDLPPQDVANDYMVKYHNRH